MFMALILYLPLTEGPGKRLHTIVKRAASKRNIELYQSIQELSERLHRPVLDVKVAVLLATDREILLEVTYLGNLLNMMRIILILPDHDPATIAKGHLLRPRFIAWLDDDFSQVETCLIKMLSLYDDPAEMADNGFT
jgi:hypothetical protein